MDVYGGHGVTFAQSLAEHKLIAGQIKMLTADEAQGQHMVDSDHRRRSVKVRLYASAWARTLASRRTVRSPMPEHQLEREVLRLLEQSIRPGSSEGNEPKRSFPELAVSNSTAESLRTLLCVYHTIESIRRAGVVVRTRAILRTGTDAVGLLWQEATGHRREIQAVLLPTKPRWQGCVEAFLRGHEETPISGATRVNKPYCLSGRLQLVDGKPNFHVIADGRPELIEQLIRAYRESSLS